MTVHRRWGGIALDWSLIALARVLCMGLMTFRSCDLYRGRQITLSLSVVHNFLVPAPPQ
jgi:hypothetical protein